MLFAYFEFAMVDCCEVWKKMLLLQYEWLVEFLQMIKPKNDFFYLLLMFWSTFYGNSNIIQIFPLKLLTYLFLLFFFKPLFMNTHHWHVTHSTSLIVICIWNTNVNNIVLVLQLTNEKFNCYVEALFYAT